MRLMNLTLAAIVALPPLGLYLWRAITGRVSPRRINRFCRRQHLTLTDENRSLVSTYLTVTRRWRSTGLVLGIVVGSLWSASEGVTVNSSAVLGGWFVGAVIAEFRLAPTDPGTVRTASLQPRQIQHRVAPAALALPVVPAALALGLGTALAAARLTGHRVDGSQVLLFLILTGAALAGPAWVGRQVLDRRQPADLEPSVRRADDAIRNRSLLVLTGCAVALAGLPVSNLALELGRAVPGVHTPMVYLAVVMFLMPVAGWLMTGVGSRPTADSDPVPSPA